MKDMLSKKARSKAYCNAQTTIANKRAKCDKEMREDRLKAISKELNDIREIKFCNFGACV